MVLRNGLVALCEGKANMNDAVYRLLRREFMNDPALSNLVPQFVRAAQDTASMWTFMKDYNPKWAPRRQFVREQFVALIDNLEGVAVQTEAIVDRVTDAPRAAEPQERPMYNLFVSGDPEAWQREPWTMGASRCVNEYTGDSIKAQYGALDAAAIEALRKLPCIFAYEMGINIPPKFGVIRDITKRQGQVRVEYEIIPIIPFLSNEDLAALQFELDIGQLELSRTHWAVKDVNLAKELQYRGIALPNWTRSISKAVDISIHRFEVALSFPGEVRPLVAKVAEHLESLIGPNGYFFDGNYVSQLARPSLDTLLQDIYRNRAKLIVVFLSADYQRKDWCGIEFRAIKDIIAERAHNRIMFVRTDDGSVDGVFSTDGYVDARHFGSQDIARFIRERVDLL